MRSRSATAIAHPNIAFIKYWGRRDSALNLPANDSISMTLGGLSTRTSVTFSADFTQDTLDLDGSPSPPGALGRTTQLLDRIRDLAGVGDWAQVSSENTFPMGAGIASSASGFAALALAATAALDLQLGLGEISRLARTASGSAARSIHGGYVLWHAGDSDDSSVAEQLAPPDHWDLVDWVIVVDSSQKKVGSDEGHSLAPSSPLQAARVGSAPERIARCRAAILQRDFEALADVAELDSDIMHAVMMTTSPPIHYWQPATVAIMARARQLRRQGLPVFCTLDAGPNPHCLCPAYAADEVARELEAVAPECEMLRAESGGPAQLFEQPE